MSDYINKAQAVAQTIAEIESLGLEVSRELERRIKNDYISQPPADVVEVVRCKGCKYWLPHTQCGSDEDNDEYHNYCNYHMPDDEWYAGYWEADDYCSYGEREDNE